MINQAKQDCIVEVFRTDVSSASEAIGVLEQLKQMFPQTKFNFDLDDCDKVLRVEGKYIQVAAVIELLSKNRYRCELLPD